MFLERWNNHKKSFQYLTTLIISIEDRIAKYTRNTIQTMADPDMQKSDAGWAELFFFLAGTYILDAVTSSGILKAKQKLGITFNSDKLGGIDFTNFSKLTMCSA